VTPFTQPALRRFRTFVLIWAFLAMLGLSTASASPAHFHGSSSSPNGCNICFTAHTVAFEAPAVQPVYGPEMAGSAILLLAVFGYQACAGQPSCSRGPPASCL
jgi:hypothetical protein